MVQSYAARSEITGPLTTLDSDPRNGPAKTALGAQLSQLLAARSEIAVTFITDAQGHLVAGRPDSPANVGVDYSYRDWYKGVAASGKTYVSNAFESAAPGRPAVVAIATPVRDANGRVIGYIGANYGLKAIQSFVGDFASSQGVQLTVTDRQGIVVAAPGSLPPGLTSDAHDSRVIAALGGNNGVRSWKANGQRLVSSYAPANTLGWAVLANTPERQAFAPISRLRTTVLTSAGVLGLVLVAGLAFLGLNLRDRARIERKSREQSEETRTILEASVDAYIAMDEHGCIVKWNGQAAETFGWPPDEAIGRRVRDTLVPVSLRDTFDDLLRQGRNIADSSMLNKRMETIAVNKDGAEFPVELVVWATQAGKGVVFSAFCHDITERKAAAMELAGARDRAMEASRLKSQFVANMSHEIRTPMNGIIGMIDMLRRTDLSEEQLAYADTVWRSSEALLDVINDILDFSKIEAGRLELAKLAFSPRAVVEEVAELLSGAAQAKGLEFATTIDPRVPLEVRGDPGRLRQIILNLVGNAVKFTDTGEVVVRCTVDEVMVDAHRTVLRFEVADSGCGIAERDKQRLFESFSQVDASSTRRHGGTGLGLSISKRLAELMGGEIGVISKDGAGSTFWFTAEFELSSGSTAQGSDMGEQGSLSGIRALVVDDNATNRTILDRMLSSWDMKVELAANGLEALSKLHDATKEGQPYAIALIDYVMPEMDGLELATRMTEDNSLKTTPRVLLASSVERANIGAVEDGLVYGCLTKPVREASLFDLISEALQVPPEADRSTDNQDEVPPPKQLLVVDDNVVNQHVMRLMLEKMGYEVAVVGDGQQALQQILLGDTTYDAVLMDCQMPVLDGYQTTRELRQREVAGTHIPVIAITAHAMDGDIDKCLEAGMDAYLAKPVLWDDLQAVLEGQLKSNTNKNHIDFHAESGGLQ